MRNALTHEDDEDFAAIRVLVGSVQFVLAEDVVAGTQILAGHAHAPLENDDGMPGLVSVRGLDITGGNLTFMSIRPVLGKNLDLHAPPAASGRTWTLPATEFHRRGWHERRDRTSHAGWVSLLVPRAWPCSRSIRHFTDYR
jgi:hypothetical protein